MFEDVADGIATVTLLRMASCWHCSNFVPFPVALLSRALSFSLSQSQRWFGHSTGHYLGNDVHDTHSLSKDIPLQAGMCVTIEPGLYIRADDETAPAAFRGLGMRIEDDLLVASSGGAAEVLSHEAAKSVDDVEALVGSGDSSAPGGLHVRPDTGAQVASAI